MPALPDRATPYHRTREFTESSIPASLVAREHVTKPGVWERIFVSEGRLQCRRHGDGERVEELAPGTEGVVEPGVPHRFEVVDGPLRVQIEFLRSGDELRGHWSARRAGRQGAPRAADLPRDG